MIYTHAFFLQRCSPATSNFSDRAGEDSEPQPEAGATPLSLSLTRLSPRHHQETGNGMVQETHLHMRTKVWGYVSLKHIFTLPSSSSSLFPFLPPHSLPYSLPYSLSYSLPYFLPFPSFFSLFPFLPPPPLSSLLSPLLPSPLPSPLLPSSPLSLFLPPSDPLGNTRVHEMAHGAGRVQPQLPGCAPHTLSL